MYVYLYYSHIFVVSIIRDRTISFYSHKNITLKPQKKLTRFLVILKYNKYVLFK